jgi:hypothetical protein
MDKDGKEKIPVGNNSHPRRRYKKKNLHYNPYEGLHGTFFSIHVPRWNKS